jgi:hypothetical protein
MMGLVRDYRAGAWSRLDFRNRHPKTNRSVLFRSLEIIGTDLAGMLMPASSTEKPEGRGQKRWLKSQIRHRCSTVSIRLGSFDPAV